MSYKLVNTVFELKLTALEKAVASAICRHTKADGRGCRASIKTLARESGASVRSVQRVIQSFERRKYLTATTPKTGGKPGAASVTHYDWMTPEICTEMIRCIESAYNKKTGDKATPDGCQPDTPRVTQGHPTGDSLSQRGDKVTSESVLESVSESVSSESVHQSTPDGGTDGFTTTKDDSEEQPGKMTSKRKAELRKIFGKFVRIWHNYFMHVKCEQPHVRRYPQAVAEAERMSESFITLQEQDYRLLDDVLHEQKPDELLSKWRWFIEEKDTKHEKDWEGCPHPFRVFVNSLPTIAA